MSALAGPFRGSEAVASGLLTRARLFGPRYRRVYPDVYLAADHPLDLLTRSRAAFLLVRDRGGVLCGYSAAALLGADRGSADSVAEVLLATNSRPHPGLRIYRGAASGTDVTSVGGVLVTSPLRTAWDLARRLPLVEAVVAVDALARAGSEGGGAGAGAGIGEAGTGGGAGAGAFEPAELLARRAAEPGARGARRLAEVVALADPRAGSPPETRLRVALVRAGLPTPEVRFPVLDEHGSELARADLAYPAAKLAIEYDRAVQPSPAQFDAAQARRDRERDGELAAIGWQTLRLAAADLDALPRTTQRVARLLELRSARE